MKMQKVDLCLTSDKRLVIRTEDGTEYFISIYNGGGYYTDFMLNTQEELDKQKQEYEAEREFRNKEATKWLEAESKKPWWKKI